MTNNNTAAAIEIRPILSDGISELLYFFARKSDSSFKSDAAEFLNHIVAHYIRMGYNMEDISATAQLKAVNNINVGDYASGTIALKVSTQHCFREEDFFFSIQAHWSYTKKQNEEALSLIAQLSAYMEEVNDESSFLTSCSTAVEAEDEE